MSESSEKVLFRLNGGPFAGTRVADTEVMPWPLPDALPDPEERGVYLKQHESQLPPQPADSRVLRGVEYEWSEYSSA